MASEVPTDAPASITDLLDRLQAATDASQRSSGVQIMIRRGSPLNSEALLYVAARDLLEAFRPARLTTADDIDALRAEAERMMISTPNPDRSDAERARREHGEMLLRVLSDLGAPRV